MVSSKEQRFSHDRGYANDLAIGVTSGSQSRQGRFMES
jgi:hypothetical protein